MRKRILLSGVHGVGKGHFIREKLEGIPDLSVISASEIINLVHVSEDAGYKRVKDVNGNQNILLSSLRTFFSTHAETILMDGHLVILDSKDRIQRIPREFFEKGMFDTLIILQDDPQIIFRRLYERDGRSEITIDLISEIQEQEEIYANELKDVGVEVCYITPYSEETSYMRYFRREVMENGVC